MQKNLNRKPLNNQTTDAAKPAVVGIAISAVIVLSSCASMPFGSQNETDSTLNNNGLIKNQSTSQFGDRFGSGLGNDAVGGAGADAGSGAGADQPKRFGDSLNASASEQLQSPRSVNLTGDFNRSKLIAADFVSTMAQLPEINPANTILHTEKPDSRFGQLLLSALQRAGFGLRLGSTQANNWLKYSADQDEQTAAASRSGNPVYTFIVAAGDVKLKRSYEVDSYGVSPAGNMFVLGATTSNVVIDDSIFNIRTPQPAEESKQPLGPIAKNEWDTQGGAIELQGGVNTGTSRIAANESVPDTADLVKGGQPTKLAGQPYVKTRKAAKREGLGGELLSDLNNLGGQVKQYPPAVKSENVLASANKIESDDPFAEVHNMYDTGKSRYDDIFQSYEVISSDVLVFPNDSLVLGVVNKQSVKQLIEVFNPSTDLVSVIGCSHGKSKIKNGNAYLANNRAFRVKEEFVAFGMDDKHVLEEGCWAGTPFAKMPARGVLVQHKRLKGANRLGKL